MSSLPRIAHSGSSKEVKCGSMASRHISPLGNGRFGDVGAVGTKARMLENNSESYCFLSVSLLSNPKILSRLILNVSFRMPFKTMSAIDLLANADSGPSIHLGHIGAVLFLGVSLTRLLWIVEILT